MNSEERFKKSLEELLASKEFSFDQANWEKARRMIDDSKKPRRIAPFILAGTLLLISLVGGFYFMYDAPPATALAASAKADTQTTVAPPALPAAAEIKESRLAAETNAPRPAAAKPGSNPDSPGTEPASANTAPAATLPATEKNLPETHTTAPDNTPELPAPAAMQETPASSGQPGQMPVAIAGATDAPSVTLPPAKDPELKNEQVYQQPENTAPVPATTFAAAEPQQEAPEKINPDEHFASDITPALPANNTDKPEGTENKTAATEPASVAAESPVTENTNTLPALSLPDSAKNNSTPADLLPLDNDGGQIGKPKEIPVLFSVEAGANYMLGWKNPGSRDASGFNPVIGINYFSTVNPKMNLSIGLHYSSISKLGFSNYTSKVTRLAFGEESRVTIFTPVKVHYLIVPLRLNYNLSTLNTIGIGCNIAYLLNVQSEVETYSEKLNTKYDETITKTSGYTQGFKKYDTQVSVFYKRTFYPKLAMNLEMYYGLTDIKDNAFFNSGVFERNMGLKLTLVYNFLKK